MKKTFLSVIASILSVIVMAQTNDIVVKHNGEKLEVKILKVGETLINYKYPGEDAEQTIGKFAVASITYGSGRKETISDKITISGKEDWEKVEILTDRAQALGLKAGDEVRGKTSGMFSYHTAGSADKKATRKIKESAAEMGAPFVLMVSDKNDGFGVKQAVKNGVTYNYK